MGSIPVGATIFAHSTTKRSLYRGRFFCYPLICAIPNVELQMLNYLYVQATKDEAEQARHKVAADWNSLWKPAAYTHTDRVGVQLKEKMKFSV